MNYHRPTLAALAGVAVMVVASSAWAHAELVSSNPAANAILTAAPKTVSLTFSEKLVPAFSKIELTMPEHDGMKVAVKTALSTDSKTLTSTPQSALTKGAYKIAWTAATADGHKMNGEVAFKVN